MKLNRLLSSDNSRAKSNQYPDLTPSILKRYISFARSPSTEAFITSIKSFNPAEKRRSSQKEVDRKRVSTMLSNSIFRLSNSKHLPKRKKTEQNPKTPISYKRGTHQMSLRAISFDKLDKGIVHRHSFAVSPVEKKSISAIAHKRLTAAYNPHSIQQIGQNFTDYLKMQYQADNERKLKVKSLNIPKSDLKAFSKGLSKLIKEYLKLSKNVKNTEFKEKLRKMIHGDFELYHTFFTFGGALKKIYESLYFYNLIISKIILIDNSDNILLKENPFHVLRPEEKVCKISNIMGYYNKLWDVHQKLTDNLNFKRESNYKILKSKYNKLLDGHLNHTFGTSLSELRDIVSFTKAVNRVKEAVHYEDVDSKIKLMTPGNNLVKKAKKIESQVGRFEDVGNAARERYQMAISCLY